MAGLIGSATPSRGEQTKQALVRRKQEVSGRRVIQGWQRDIWRAELGTPMGEAAVTSDMFNHQALVLTGREPRV